MWNFIKYLIHILDSINFPELRNISFFSRNIFIQGKFQKIIFFIIKIYIMNDDWFHGMINTAHKNKWVSV